jgi:hypothetical protein
VNKPLFAAAIGLTVFSGIFSGVGFLADRASAATVVLYDGALGGTPDTQSLLYQSVGGAVQTYDAVNKWTNLNTIPDGNGNLVGYGTTAVTLNRTVGYNINFSVQMLAESSVSPVRAGFSVIAISNDVGSGIPSSIEIGFNNGKVFAQNDSPLFGNPPAQQNTSFNPVGAGLVSYDLTIFGSSYQLFANGSSILTGGLRDYSASPFPIYSTANSVFFGDNTTSAQANLNLSFAALASPVPFEFSPGLGLLLSGGMFGTIAFRKRRQRNIKQQTL